MTEHTGMTDNTAVPDYDLADVFEVRDPAQYKALFDDTRLQIIDLLSERAATISELAEALGRPKGTIGHHIGVLDDAGLIRVVRTKRVRALEAKYWGRTARTFEYSGMIEAGVLPPEHAMATAATDIAQARKDFAGDEENLAGIQGVRYARIPLDRAKQWEARLRDLVDEFVSQPRSGDTVYGLAVALYPTVRPHLNDE